MEKRKRFIKISRNLLEGIKFDSVEDFRALFFMKVEVDIFSGENTKFISKVFKEEELLFIFKHKKKVSRSKFVGLISSLESKGVNKTSISTEEGGFIILEDTEVSNVKGVNQIYALIISKWAKGNTNVYFKKETFYKWFDCNPSDRATVFKRAMKGIGLQDAEYKIKGNSLVIYRNRIPLVEPEVIVEVKDVNPMQKKVDDLYLDATLEDYLNGICNFQ